MSKNKMQPKRLKQIRTKNNVVICYARNGHRLYEGNRKDIPEELKQYYVYQKINNDRYSYIEIIEDTTWFTD